MLYICHLYFTPIVPLAEYHTSSNIAIVQVALVVCPLFCTKIKACGVRVLASYKKRHDAAIGESWKECEK